MTYYSHHGRYQNRSQTDWFVDPFAPKETKTQGWLREISGLFLVVAVLCCLPLGFELMKGGKTDYSSVSTLSRAQFVHQLEVIDHELDTNHLGAPVDYYRTINRRFDPDRTLEKFRETDPDGRTLAGHYGMAFGEQQRVTALQIAYDERYGHSTMMDAAYTYWHSGNQDRTGLTGRHLDLPDKGVDWPVFGLKFIWAWAFSSAIMAGYYILQLKRKELKTLPEFFELVFWSVFWLVGVWRYPHSVNPLKQAQKGLRHAAYAMGALLSLTAVAAKAAERRPDAPDGATVGNVLVLSQSDLPKPPPLYTFTGTSGVMSAKVAGNGYPVHFGPVLKFDANVAFRSGAYVDVSGTRALSGAKGSDETDLAVGKVLKVGRGTLDASLNYYDIRPLWTGKGGDIISPILQYNQPVGHGWTGFVHGEYDFLTHGSANRNGYLVAMGASHSDHLGHLKLDQTFSLAYGDGPFGQQAGAVARYEGTLSVPFWQRTLGWFKVKGYAPVSGARDRRPVASASLGLTIAR